MLKRLIFAPEKERTAAECYTRGPGGNKSTGASPYLVDERSGRDVPSRNQARDACSAPIRVLRGCDN